MLSKWYFVFYTYLYVIVNSHVHCSVGLTFQSARVVNIGNFSTFASFISLEKSLDQQGSATTYIDSAMQWMQIFMEPIPGTEMQKDNFFTLARFEPK